jgi:hypothetical protein
LVCENAEKHSANAMSDVSSSFFMFLFF